MGHICRSAGLQRRYFTDGNAATSSPISLFLRFRTYWIDTGIIIFVAQIPIQIPFMAKSYHIVESPSVRKLRTDFFVFTFFTTLVVDP